LRGLTSPVGELTESVTDTHRDRQTHTQVNLYLYKFILVLYVGLFTHLFHYNCFVIARVEPAKQKKMELA